MPTRQTMGVHNMNKKLFGALCVGVSTLGLVLAAPASADAATSNMSGTQNCAAQYYAGVKGQQDPGAGGSALMQLQMPSGTTVVSWYGTYATSYLSTRQGSTWTVTSSSTAYGLIPSATGGYCAPAV